MEDFFAVIDTETTWSDRVMTMGVAVARPGTFELVDSLYFVFVPEISEGGMFSSSVSVRNDVMTNKCCREDAILSTCEYLRDNGIDRLFAYNASFDFNHLPELRSFRWFDIMKIAANVNYNPYIPSWMETCKTGRLKRNYDVESMMRILSGRRSFFETHNAMYDAIDELKIMEYLGLDITVYEDAELPLGKKRSPGKCGVR